MKNKIDIVLSPELIPAYRQPGSVAVVIDVLRASTTITTAMAHGAKAIYPLETVEEAEEIYFTTTNGTRTIKAAIAEGYRVVVGTFVNLSAVARFCQGQDVLAICAGWQGRPSKEDTLFAAALCDALSESHEVVTDVSQMMVELWQAHKGSLTEYIKESNHYPRMVRAGKEGALDFCLTIDAMEVLPITELEGETIKLVRHE